MLKAFARWILREEAQPTRKGHREEYVTPEQLREALEEVTKESEYALNEWYEKFNALHLRLSKRVAREEKKANGGTATARMREGHEESPVSAIHFRRMGSV